MSEVAGTVEKSSREEKCHRKELQKSDHEYPGFFSKTTICSDIGRNSVSSCKRATGTHELNSSQNAPRVTGKGSHLSHSRDQEGPHLRSGAKLDLIVKDTLDLNKA